MIRLLFCMVCLLGCLTPAARAGNAATPGAPAVQRAADGNRADADVATRLTALTTLAISPILVGGGRSAWLYWHASDEERRHLPWQARPWYWGPLLALGLFFFLAHLVGTSVPFLSKTVDAARTVESKLSLLYASPLFLAAGAALLQSMEKAGIAVSPLGNAVAASTVVTGTPVDHVAGGLLGCAVFVVIWLSNQAMHTIALLSPVALLGVSVRLLHMLVLGTILLAGAVSPSCGAILALLLVVFCAWIAGWSLRLSVFGTVFAWDLLLLRRAQPVGQGVLAFSARALPLPSRTMGRLVQTAHGLALAYRPWLIGPARMTVLPAGGRVLRHGVFYSQIVQARDRGSLPMVTLPPRYRGSETALAAFAACTATPSSLKGGLRGALAWLRQL